jgi:hypothetical protein
LTNTVLLQTEQERLGKNIWLRCLHFLSRSLLLSPRYPAPLDASGIRQKITYCAHRRQGRRVTQCPGCCDRNWELGYRFWYRSLFYPCSCAPILLTASCLANAYPSVNVFGIDISRMQLEKFALLSLKSVI